VKMLVRYCEEEEWPVASLDKDLYDWDSVNNVEVTPDEWYTAEIYENLRDQAQKYCYSFASRS